MNSDSLIEILDGGKLTLLPRLWLRAASTCQLEAPVSREGRMRFSLKFGCILVAVLSISGGTTLPCRGQTNFPPCREDGSPPDGHEQCECHKPPMIYRGEYRNPEQRYQVHLPDGVAAIDPSCGRGGGGFKISLTHPDSGESEGELGWNLIWVGRSERNNQGFQQIADQWAQYQREDSQRDHSTDLQIDPPVQTSLSSLPAIELKASRTQLDRGKLIYEVMFAKDHDNYVYVLGMVSPLDRYDKGHELFQAVVEGFRYIPPERSATQ